MMSRNKAALEISSSSATTTTSSAAVAQQQARRRGTTTTTTDAAVTTTTGASLNSSSSISHRGGSNSGSGGNTTNREHDTQFQRQIKDMLLCRRRSQTTRSSATTHQRKDGYRDAICILVAVLLLIIVVDIVNESSSSQKKQLPPTKHLVDVVPSVPTTSSSSSSSSIITTTRINQLRQQQHRLRGPETTVAKVTTTASSSPFKASTTSQQQQSQQHRSATDAKPQTTTTKDGLIAAWLRWMIAASNDKDASTQQQQEHQRIADAFQAKHPGTKVESCQWVSYRTDTENIRIQTLCQQATSTSDNNMKLVYYNPLPNHERILCSNNNATTTKPIIIRPLDSIVVDSSIVCNNNDNDDVFLYPPTLFPVEPQVSNAHLLPPIRTRFSGYEAYNGDSHSRLFPDCNVPCQSLGGPGTVTTRYVDAIDGSTWTLDFSMEGPQYYSNLYIDKNEWKKHHYWSTTSYDSEIPLPYYSKAEYHIQTKNPPVNYDTAIHGAVFLARNCDSKNNREQRVRELQASTIRVDSLSSCLHNADPPPGVDLQNKIQVMQHYLFYLAFENQCVNDYITEKLWGPMESGTVPIYYGAPNVMDHVPHNSIINVNDYPNTNALVEQLQRIIANKTLYESYHAWRKQPLPPNFQRRYNLTDTHSTCRTCRWAYARMYGLGWNHSQQEIQSLASGPRHVCLYDDGATQQPHLIRQPFIEGWISKKTASSQAVSISSSTTNEQGRRVVDENDLCTLTERNRMVLIDGRLQRTVRYQDGVVDMLIERGTSSANTIRKTIQNDKEDIVLTLTLPLQASATTPLKTIRTGASWIQDKVTRYTLLTRPTNVKITTTTAAESHDHPIVEISMATLPLQTRIIVEDIDTFHKGADQEENIFGKLMTDDFFHPVEVFVQDSASS